MSQIITSLSELCTMLDIDITQINNPDLQPKFPLKVPLSFVRRMKKGDIHDPLFLQCLPLGIENRIVDDYSQDPLSEQQAKKVPGLLHKYQSRVLLTVAGTCAINCRFCFRRHFPYEEIPKLFNWQPALEYIHADKGISEVILSGGDPLTLKDHQLKSLVMELEKIPHLKRLRIHSRLPIVTPERISDDFLQWLSSTRLQVIMVIHCNHPNEIDREVVETLNRIRRAQITLLNQSVLLRGINDDADVLIHLSEKLFAAGVLPYYLHLLDKVAGTFHFDLPLDRAKDLHRKMQAHLPGYLVPKLVREVPGEKSKQIL